MSSICALVMPMAFFFNWYQDEEIGRREAENVHHPVPADGKRAYTENLRIYAGIGNHLSAPVRGGTTRFHHFHPFFPLVVRTSGSLLRLNFRNSLRPRGPSADPTRL